jgi:hypothetical protein
MMRIRRVITQGTRVIAEMMAIGLVWSAVAAAQPAGKKVLLIDSYHEKYEWSDGIVAGVKSALSGKGVELKVVRMDTKRNSAAEFAKAAGIQARETIESFKPDVVIACDDNASKYVVEPFYKNAALPVVFCGVNWDAAATAIPTRTPRGWSRSP